jgi:hypothetical protein
MPYVIEKGKISHAMNNIVYSVKGTQQNCCMKVKMKIMNSKPVAL